MREKAPISATELFHILAQNNDELAWGEHIFSNDLLVGRISETQKREWIYDAVACGQEWAKALKDQYGDCSPIELAHLLGCEITYADQEVVNIPNLFAQFTPPNQITIMERPLKQYDDNCLQESWTGLPSVEEVKNLLIAHEIFHFIEEKNEETIYTRQKKLVLWKFWKWKHVSSVRSISEVSAMAFAKAFTNCCFQPALVDFFLFHPYGDYLPEDSLLGKKV